MSDTKIKEMILTDEIKETLKGTLGFDVGDPFPYVPKAYRKKDDSGAFIVPKEMWAVFTLRSKDGIEAADAEDDSGYATYDDKAKEVKTYLQSGKARVANLRAGILKVKNLLCEDGSTINFEAAMKQMNRIDKDGKNHIKNGADTKALIRFIRPELQLELANAINERKTLSQEELQGLEF